MAAQRRGEGVEETKAPAPADETKPKPKWGGGINLASDSGTPKLGGGGLASRMAAFQKKDVTRAGFGMGGGAEKKEEERRRKKKKEEERRRKKKEEERRRKKKKEEERR